MTKELANDLRKAALEIATAERDSRTPMEVAIAVSYKNDTPAMQIIFIMAAAVELAEPSTDMRE